MPVSIEGDAGVYTQKILFEQHAGVIDNFLHPTAAGSYTYTTQCLRNIFILVGTEHQDYGTHISIPALNI